MTARTLFCAQNRTRLELYVGVSRQACPTKTALLGARRPSSLSRWAKGNRLHIEPIGRVPPAFVGTFLRAFLRPFLEAGFRPVGRLACGRRPAAY